MPRWIGIDPGLSGALAILGDHGEVQFFDTPTLTIQGAKKKTRVMDGAECVNILMREVGRCAEIMVVLEKESAMPGQGVSSMFNFGTGYGMWQGILYGLQLPFTLVHAATWKRRIMEGMGKEKSAAIFRAKQLYPKAASSLTRVKDDGRAEALLLAHYGRVFLPHESACVLSDAL